jgi:hypothetical protein
MNADAVMKVLKPPMSAIRYAPIARYRTNLHAYYHAYYYKDITPRCFAASSAKQGHDTEP